MEQKGESLLLDWAQSFDWCEPFGMKTSPLFCFFFLPKLQESFGGGCGHKISNMLSQKDLEMGGFI